MKSQFLDKIKFKLFLFCVANKMLTVLRVGVLPSADYTGLHLLGEVDARERIARWLDQVYFLDPRVQARVVLELTELTVAQRGVAQASDGTVGVELTRGAVQTGHARAIVVAVYARFGFFFLIFGKNISITIENYKKLPGWKILFVVV
jgi:hypothetical protein